jgi:HEAT repeat protein
MVDALGDIGDPRASWALLERLRLDEYVPVRVQAALALAKLGDRHLVPLIEQATSHETEPTVLSAAKSATTTLKSKPN